MDFLYPPTTSGCALGSPGRAPEQGRFKEPTNYNGPFIPSWPFSRRYGPHKMVLNFWCIHIPYMPVPLQPVPRKYRIYFHLLHRITSYSHIWGKTKKQICKGQTPVFPKLMMEIDSQRDFDMCDLTAHERCVLPGTRTAAAAPPTSIPKLKAMTGSRWESGGLPTQRDRGQDVEGHKGLIGTCASACQEYTEKHNQRQAAYQPAYRESEHGIAVRAAYRKSNQMAEARAVYSERLTNRVAAGNLSSQYPTPWHLPRYEGRLLHRWHKKLHL